MNNLYRILLVCFATMPVLALESSEAKIEGQSYLGILGHSIQINLGDQACQISSRGDSQEKSFWIEFRCNNTYQILWDINRPVAGDFSFDEPNFELLWAGDKDGDGKIDIEMNMSPKYSCNKRVTYLSTKAEKGQLLGVSGIPQTVCGP